MESAKENDIILNQALKKKKVQFETEPIFWRPCKGTKSANNPGHQGKEEETQHPGEPNCACRSSTAGGGSPAVFIQAQS